MRAPDRSRRSAPLLLLLAFACGGEAPAPEHLPSDSSAPASGSTPGPTPTTEPGTSTGEPSPSADGWTSGILTAEAELPSLPPVPVVQAVRTGAHEGFDRVTIEIAGVGLPGYHAEYVDKPLHQCGSGNEVFPVGQGWLEIRLEPAQAHTEQGAATLPGREIEATGRLLRRIYVICDFEGVVSLVLALDSPNPYQVSRLSGPGRIVVDVRH